MEGRQARGNKWLEKVSEGKGDVLKEARKSNLAPLTSLRSKSAPPHPRMHLQVLWDTQEVNSKGFEKNYGRDPHQKIIHHVCPLWVVAVTQRRHKSLKSCETPESLHFPCSMANSTTTAVKSLGGPGPAGRSSPEGSQVLSKKKLQDLVREIDPNEQLDEDVEEMLLQIADDFIESVVTAACQLARHRKSNTLEVKDVQLHLERQWNMWIPGFGSDEIRPFKKACTTEAHKQCLWGGALNPIPAFLQLYLTTQKTLIDPSSEKFKALPHIMARLGGGLHATSVYRPFESTNQSPKSRCHQDDGERQIAVATDRWQVEGVSAPRKFACIPLMSRKLKLQKSRSGLRAKGRQSQSMLLQM
ncbi:hypothetical protein INR49_001547 [Caranx melampygus]|nr:hypothetical protein INR49_001547 [Caranx melampygus]